MRQVETLFWAEPGMAVLPSGYAWCLATAFDCQIWSTDGVHVRTIRADVETPAITDADVGELKTMRLADATTAADSSLASAGIAEATRMAHLPVLSLIRTDAAGRIWIRPFVWRRGDTTATWVVMEPSGRVLGTVTMPASLQLFDIGDDYVLGVDRDADDAERVVLYPYARVR
jgi:hypothetical protein